MIFYFTATGNSKYLAERIAAGTDDSVINIAECIQTGAFSFELNDGEPLGFVVPVYFYGIPVIVTEFLEKLNITPKPDTYSFAVLNSGGTTAYAEKFIRRSFAVDALFGIKTVGNYVPLYKMVGTGSISAQLDKAETDTDDVIRYIKERKNGDFNDFRGVFPRLLTTLAYPLYKNGRKTKKFTVNENCTGCGSCAEVCPRRIIRLHDKMPVWESPQCELCLACLHRCPQAAINYGRKSAGNGRYLNDRVDF